MTGASSAVRLLAVAGGMVIATVVAGWIGVAVLAGACGVAAARLRVRPLAIGAAASGAWALLLLAQAILAPVGTLAALIGGVLGVPGVIPILLTLLLPFLLAWPAGYLGAELARLTRRRGGEPRDEPVAPDAAPSQEASAVS